MVRAFAHGAMGCRIDPSWCTHLAISRFSECSMTGVTKAMVCGMMHIKESERVAYEAAVGFLSRYLSGPLPLVCCHITVNKMC